MKRTGLNGFTTQYDERVVEQLNKVVGPRSYSNEDLRKIGRAVSRKASHSSHDETDDGYGWFGRLDYTVDGAKMAILFPWAQDWNHHETEMDRSVNVYSDRELPRAVVGNLLENIASQMTLAIRPTKRR